MTLHKEINFEDEICEYLKVHDWLYAPNDAQSYDRFDQLRQSPSR